MSEEPTSRRQFHRRQGTGRQTILRSIGTIGRRSGIPINSNVSKDEYGMDNIEELWAPVSPSEQEQHDPNRRNPRRDTMEGKKLFLPSSTSPAQDSIQEEKTPSFEPEQQSEQDLLHPLNLDVGSYPEQPMEQDEMPSPSTSPLETAPKTKRGRVGGNAKKRRRQTMQMIAEAQENGLAEIIQDGTESINSTGVRRSQRTRQKPLAFYKNEKINYKEGPMGLPSIDEKEPVIKEVQSPPVMSRSKPRRKRKKSVKKKKEEEEEEEEEESEFEGKGWYYDEISRKDKKGEIAARASCLEFGALFSEEQGVVGTKAAEFGGLTSGFLRIAPGGKKPEEVVGNSECFFVASCEHRCLSVRIHNTEFKLSKGDTFTVPPDNKYSLHNTSRKKDVALFFALVAPS